MKKNVKEYPLTEKSRRLLSIGHKGLLLLFLIGVFFLVPITALADDDDSFDPDKDSSMALEGYTGLINTPTADVIEEGKWSFNYSENISILAGDLRFRDRDQRSLFLSIGFLPNAEITMRFTRFPEVESNIPGFGPYRDRSFNGKWRFFTPKDRRLPRIALGVEDPLGTQVFKGKYIVGTETLPKDLLRSRVSIGYSSGHLEGLFGGIEVPLHHSASIAWEYDTKDSNFGIKLKPTRSLRLTLAKLGADDLGFNAEYRRSLSFEEDEAEVMKRISSLELKEVGPEELADKLVEAGFENVMVYLENRPKASGEEPALVLEFEDRIYRNPLDGLAKAAQITSSSRRDGTVRLVPKIRNLPILTLDFRPDRFRAWANGQSDEKQFGSELRIISFQMLQRPEDAKQEFKNRSFFRTDLALRPIFNFREPIYAEGNNPYKFRYGLELNSYTSPFTGGSASGIGQWYWKDEFHTGEERINFTRAVFSQAAILPLNILGKAAFSYAEFPNEYAVSGEFLKLFNDGRNGLGAVAEFTGDFDTDVHSLKTMFLELDQRIPKYDLRARLRGGRFAGKGDGFSFSLEKYFGDSTFQFFVIRAEDTLHKPFSPKYGLMTGFFLTVPIGREKKSNPKAIRLMIDDYYDFTYRSRGAPVYEKAGRLFLLPRNELEYEMLKRGRYNPSYIRAHIGELLRIGL